MLPAKTYLYSVCGVKVNILHCLSNASATKRQLLMKNSSAGSEETHKTTPGLLTGSSSTEGTQSVVGRWEYFLPVYSRCGAHCYEHGEKSTKPFLSNGPAIRKASCTTQRGDCSQKCLNCTTEYQIICLPLWERTLTE